MSNVVKAWNQDTLHDTVLILDAMNAKNTATVTHTEATPDHNKGTGTATTEAAQGSPFQHTKSTATELTMTHHRSCTHCSSSGYHSQDCSRWHSCPSYRLTKYNPSLRKSCSSRSYCNQGTQRLHPDRNRKVHIEEPSIGFLQFER